MKNKNLINAKHLFLIVGIIIIVILGKGIFTRYFFNERLTVIPNVLNLSEEEAKKYLKKAGLKVKVNYSVTEKAMKDAVYIQFPEAGNKVKINRTIQIWVNSGESVEIPDVIGMELLEARPILDAQNIHIERIDYQPSNQKYNTIIGIYPEPGTKVEVNQKISLLVSSQKISDPSVMPDLVGLDIDNAKEILNQMGLQVGEISYAEDLTLPVGVIVSSYPMATAKVMPETRISLVINKGVAVQEEEQTIEDIINQTKKEVLNREIENIINETLNKIENTIKKENKDSKENKESQETKETNKTEAEE